MKFIIDFKNHLTQQEIDSHIQSLGGTIVKSYNSFNKVYLIECMVPPVFDGSIHEHVIDDNTQPLQLLSTTIVSDQTWGTRKLDGATITVSTSDNNDWWKNYILSGAELDKPSYTIDKRGAETVIYVLDSGCDLGHQEFIGRPVINLFSFNNSFNDTNGHGTAITSVITGANCGLTEATVKVVKIFDSTQPTLQSDMVNALDSIYQDFVNNDVGFAIINCSWTISKNLFIESKLQSLMDLGMVVVAAAGNNGIPIEDVTPASMDTAITVGSFNNNLVPSDFSNYTGSEISVSLYETNFGALDGWAPGEQIYCATLNNGYGMVAGTSIAAGIHSAVCAYNLSVSKIEYSLNYTLDNYIRTIGFQREGLLDLSGSYVNCVNKISTAKDIVQVVTSEDKLGMICKAESSKQYYVRIFDPRNTIKLEIIDELPYGTKVSETGIFSGIAPSVDSVTVIPLQMKIYTTNNKVHDFVFEVITMPFGYDTSQSTGDSILDIKLASTNCTLNPCESETFDNCVDNCIASICDNTYSKVACPFSPNLVCFCG